MSNDFKIEVCYGFVCLENLTRTLPDGSIEFGCRVRRYDNPPSQPEHLVSDKVEWSGNRLVLA